MVYTGVARQYFSRPIAPAKAWCHASKVASQTEKVNECRQSPFSWQNYADVLRGLALAGWWLGKLMLPKYQ